MCRCGRRRKHARRVMACWPSQLTSPHTHRVCSSCLLSVIVDRILRRDRSLYARASSCHLPIALLRRDRQEPTFATVCQRANLATWYRRRLRAHDSRLGRRWLLHGRTPRRVRGRRGSGSGELDLDADYMHSQSQVPCSSCTCMLGHAVHEPCTARVRYRHE